MSTLTATRTTVAIQNDALLFARSAARKDNISIGEAISRLIRNQMPNQEKTRKLLPPKSKYTVLRDDGGPRLTTQEVYRIIDEIGI